MDKGQDWRAPELDGQGRMKREEPPLTITGLLREAARRPPATSSALSLVLDQHELADAEIPVTVKDGATLMKPAPRPDFEGLAAQERAARPELAEMTRDPGVATALDDAFAASKYGNGVPYHGEAGGYIVQDSEGRYFAQPYQITGYRLEPLRIWTDDSGPSTIGNFLHNRKVVAKYHAHPNGGEWQAGPTDWDIRHSNVPVITRAPDGVHYPIGMPYKGASKPDRPAPYHGLFNWFGN